jgi:VIT1/CCC1 family predicted Fe2+/Mn2+ transporter
LFFLLDFYLGWSQRLYLSHVMRLFQRKNFGLLFLAGSVPSVLPFAFMSDPDEALVVAAIGAAVGLFVVGVVKTRLTRTNPFTSGLENVAVAGVGAVISYYIGLGYDTFVG